MNNLLKVKGTYGLPHIIRAEWTGYLIFSIFFIPISLLWIIVGYKNPSQNLLLPDLIPWIILTIFLIWLASFKIVLNTNGIFYKTLFSKGSEIKLSQVKKVEIAVGIYPSERERTARGSYYRLNIFRNDIEKPFSINIKPFSKRDIAILIDAITIQNPSVELDKLSQNLKEGNFRSITSAGIRKFWQVLLWLFWLFLTLILISHFFQ